ncbi:MAG: alkaline phosphatase, partial [Pseudohongiellaceae bacterium]
MRIRSALLSGILPMAIAANAAALVLPFHQSNNPWYTDAEATTATKTAAATPIKAKNVILFVGDGMGVSTLTAARILQGQQNGDSGEEGYLSFETFPHTA